MGRKHLKEPQRTTLARKRSRKRSGSGGFFLFLILGTHAGLLLLECQIQHAICSEARDRLGSIDRQSGTIQYYGWKERILCNSLIINSNLVGFSAQPSFCSVKSREQPLRRSSSKRSHEERRDSTPSFYISHPRCAWTTAIISTPPSELLCPPLPLSNTQHDVQKAPTK